MQTYPMKREAGGLRDLPNKSLINQQFENAKKTVFELTGRSYIFLDKIKFHSLEGQIGWI